ncbi:glycoside hydrolase family 16 protein [Kitasatospora sp. NPDC093679]|uniref:glycoside hydrolase family 16 protein n=1 Tax=Kitasatospora sp. NPDC093679 TaxID=3154983 RepID=UPI0034327AD3
MAGPHLRLVLALLAWAGVAATTLTAGPVRTATAAVALLAVPGTALVLRCRWPAGVRQAPLTAVVPALACSAVLSAVAAVPMLLTHTFTPRRVLVVLAVLTTLLVLPYPRRRWPPPDPGTWSGRSAPPPPAGRQNGRSLRAGALAAACLLAGAAACADPTALTSPASKARAESEGTVRATEPPNLPGPWHLVFHDDFDGSRLNTADWTTCYDWNLGGCTNAGNHELEWYLPGQVSVADGDLTLTAQRRETHGTDGKTYPWTSGMVTTGRDHWDGTPRHTFTYGYYAAAIKVPAQAEGMFPAFWLIPAETRGTPPEIDIAEFINTATHVSANLHWRAPDGNDTHIGKDYGPQDFADGYHVYAVDWQPDSVTWYVDGVQRFRVTEPTAIPHVAMELVLNLAVGFQTAPSPGTDSAALKVGWVSVWQR